MVSSSVTPLSLPFYQNPDCHHFHLLLCSFLLLSLQICLKGQIINTSQKTTSDFWGSQPWNPSTGDNYRGFSVYIFSTCSLNKFCLIPPLHDHTGTIYVFCRFSFCFSASELEHTYPSTCKLTGLILHPISR